MVSNITKEEWLFEKAVLSPKNDYIINHKILDAVDGASKNYVFVDTVMTSDDSTVYPVEFFNSLELTGVPSHTLQLKVGVGVILMRNLDTSQVLIC